MMLRVAALEAEVADLRALMTPKPHPPSDRDRAILAEIVALAPNDEPFQTGDLTDDPETAKRWGEALARLLRHSPVDGVEIERVGGVGHRRKWRLRYVGQPRAS